MTRPFHTSADLTEAEAVIEGDQYVNALYRRVEAQAFDLLARQQPVAGDLRVLVTSLRIVVDLERAGDYAVHLAKIARRRHPAGAVPAQFRGSVSLSWPHRDGLIWPHLRHARASL